MQQGTAVSGRARGAAADVPGGGAAHAVPGPGARGRHAAAPGPAARRPGAPQSRPQACRPATTPPVWPPPTDSLLSACRQPPCFAAPPRHGLSALWRRTLDSEAHLLLEGGTSSLPSLRPWCAERVPPPAGARAEHTNGAALGRSSCTRRSSGPWSLPRARPRGGLVRRRPAALPLGCFMCLWTACSRKQRNCRDPETVRIPCLHASAMWSAASLVSAA
jgi:hypothetical protein